MPLPALSALLVFESLHGEMFDAAELHELTQRGLVTHNRKGYYALTWAARRLIDGKETEK